MVQNNRHPFRIGLVNTSLVEAQSFFKIPVAMERGCIVEHRVNLARRKIVSALGERQIVLGVFFLFAEDAELIDDGFGVVRIAQQIVRVGAIFLCVAHAASRSTEIFAIVGSVSWIASMFMPCGMIR